MTFELPGDPPFGGAEDGLELGKFDGTILAKVSALPDSPDGAAFDGTSLNVD